MARRLRTGSLATSHRGTRTWRVVRGSLATTPFILVERIPTVVGEEVDGETISMYRSELTPVTRRKTRRSRDMPKKITITSKKAKGKGTKKGAVAKKGKAKAKRSEQTGMFKVQAVSILVPSKSSPLHGVGGLSEIDAARFRDTPRLKAADGLAFIRINGRVSQFIVRVEKGTACACAGKREDLKGRNSHRVVADALVAAPKTILNGKQHIL